MLLWFAGLSVVLVALVFDSPAVDQRLVMAGSVLPVLEAAVGGPWIAHTLVFSVVVLAAVMVVGRGRRLFQRRWLGIPIGLFVHLVLDGAWADQELFWWPFLGGDALGDGPLPELGRSVPVIVALEVAGAAALVWLWRRFGLDDAERRARFLRTGRLEPVRPDTIS